MSKALTQADSSTSTQDARLIRELILPGELERSSSSMVHGREDYVVGFHSRTRSSSLCSLLSWADVSVCSREVRYFFFFFPNIWWFWGFGSRVEEKVHCHPMW